VARSILEELLLDFEDYPRHRHLALWAPSSWEASAVREVPMQFRKDQTDSERWGLYASWLEHESVGVRANDIICLIHQTNRNLQFTEDQIQSDVDPLVKILTLVKLWSVGKKGRKGRKGEERRDAHAPGIRC
jgi:hypothetical protein